jgi:proton glutamate symport protein
VIDSRRITVWSLVALAAGLGVGMLLYRHEAPWVGMVLEVMRRAGRVWITALQLTVVPLVVTQVVVAILRTRRLGSLGARTLLVFSAMLLSAAVFTLLVTPPLLSLYPVDRNVVLALLQGVTVPPDGADPAATARTVTGWLGGMIPDGLRRFLLGQYLLLLLLGAALAALVVRQLTGPVREAIQLAVEWAARMTMAIVAVLLVVAPLGVLALSFGLAQSTGTSALGLLSAFVIITVTAVLLFTALLYPLTAMLGRVRVLRFARAIGPAQVVALSSRSSLAALPAMVEAAQEDLDLPPSATGFVLPFAVATVKVSRAMSAPIMLLFLAHALDLPMGPEKLFGFMASVLLLSFAVAGLPGRGPEPSLLPLYVAAGIPLEGVMILEAVDAIPDMFKSMLNVTCNMSAAVIVSRE